MGFKFELCFCLEDQELENFSYRFPFYLNIPNLPNSLNMYYNTAQNDRRRRRSAMIKTAIVMIVLVLALLGPEILPDALLDLFREAPASLPDAAQASA